LTKTRLTVAVVDDDSSVRRGVARLLRASGYAVETFSSAAEFLERRSSLRAGCLVLDVSMPGETGLDLHDALRAAGDDTPVVFISGHGDAAMAARVNAVGREILAKPFDDEVLLRALERATRNRRPRRS
jgi:FixJ family two-component response regulator